MYQWYLICFLAALAVFIAFANQFVLKLQPTIAITTGSVLISLALMLGVEMAGGDLAVAVNQAVASLDFNKLLLQGMLGFLLFAGAIEINLAALRKQKWEITILVLFSTLASTFIVGGLSHWLLGLLGWPVPFIYCLLFGALISPTDPIAVLAIIKQLKAPEGISVQVEGESLFNDGVGLVVFTTLYAVAFSGAEPSASGVAELFLVDALGGVAFGFVLALAGHYLIVKSKSPNMRLMITLMVPSAGFALANILGISGALAMVVSGIFLGNVTRNKVANPNDLAGTHYVYNFWHAIESLLNSVLFLLIGLLLVSLPVTWEQVGLAALMIPVVLIARFISVGLPYLGFKRFRRYDVNSVRILTWGGLRGGLALAMAAAIPSGALMVNGTDLHALVVLMTYVVVIFSIIVQGSTISPLIRRSIAAAESRG